MTRVDEVRGIPTREEIKTAVDHYVPEALKRVYFNDLIVLAQAYLNGELVAVEQVAKHFPSQKEITDAILAKQAEKLTEPQEEPSHD